MLGQPWIVWVGVLVGVGLLVVLVREFWCWYWKINRMLAIGEEAIRVLQGIEIKLQVLQNQAQDAKERDRPVRAC